MKLVVEKGTKDWMVCISTRQNTTNFVPFQQFGLRSMIVLETEHAEKQGWGKRLKQVAQKYGKTVDLVSLGGGTDLCLMIEIIQNVTAQFESAVWNIGGGQKMQQLALLSVFLERKNMGKKDWACYADPGTKKIFEIQGNETGLVSKEMPIGTNIQLDDVLTIFGLEKRDKHEPVFLWRADKKEELPDISKFRDLSLFENIGERHKLLNWEMLKQGDEPLVLKGLKHGYSDYFEQVVQFEVAKILSKKAPYHHVSEAWANVRVKDPVLGGSQEIAEWDVALVTDFGTLLILDAKTGSFESKDECARLFNLEKATGVYGSFWPVIPYMIEDMSPGGFYDQHGEDGKRNKKIPFELGKLNSRFLAITGGIEEIFLKKGNKDKVQIIRKSEKEAINNPKKTMRIPNLHSFLEETKLLKTI